MSTPDIEDIYELSPLQQGMLFHTLYAPESGVYLEQESFPLHGTIDVPALVRAWQHVVERHPVLRSSFHWEGLKKPVQVVHRQPQLPVDIQDWRRLSAREQEERLDAYLKSDREKGFELSKAPLLRVAILERGDELIQFMLTFHHILLDGWSHRLITEEVWAFYEACCEGKDVRLAPVRPYGDFIAWLQRQDLAKAEVFWRQVLKGFNAPTQFGIDRPARGKPEADVDQAEQSVRLSKQTTSALQRLARESRLTLNTLIQGAWAVVLSRYSGDTDVVFGTVVSGRPATLAGVESMVGLFINTLPLRTQVLPDAFPVPWLKDLQARQLEARDYEYGALVDIQGWSEVPAGVPLFESIVIFENYPVSSPPAEDDDSTKEEGSYRCFEKTNYPLNLMVMPAPRLDLKILYSQQRFDDAAIARMLVHIRTFLEGLAADADRRLADLPLLAPAELRQLLIEWNATEAEYPRDACIHELFEAQVACNPEATALMCESKELSYRELNRRANQLAHHLQGLGVGPEVIVGICMERSVEMMVGLLGILKGGGAYLPLDPGYPQERLAFMLADVQAPVLLTQQRLVERLPAHGARLVCLDADWELIARGRENNPTRMATPDNLAYVIYTSGSTGRPKGVAMSHRPLANLLSWQLQNSTLPGGAKTLQFAPISFDVFFQEAFSTWCAGGTLLLIAEGLRRDAAELASFLKDQAVERLFLPSVALHHLAEAAGGGRGLTSLREVITAGEQLQVTQPVARWFSEATGCTLYNQYGPSESHVVTAFTLTGPPSGWPALPPIGRPIANTQIYLLDPQLQPVPVGVPGELYIGGVCLARGYLRRPELTAERFVPHPFSPEPGARLYRTGDLGRYLADGNIEFLGRTDRQVKIRGFRVECGEVEVVLGGHPGVQDVVVLVREDRPRDKRLVAYIVPARGQAPTTGALSSFLKEQLPEYMVPSTFVLLDELPFTPSGKLDRQALPAPSQARSAPEQTYVAPRMPVEEVLVKMYAEVLALEHVGVNDNFFSDLSGHSLLATQLVSRIRDNFQIELPLRAVFDKPTVGELAQALLDDAVQRFKVEKTAELLLTLDQCSDEEIEARLVQAKLSTQGG
jgi:amino acid adenylation domain-containing protein